MNAINEVRIPRIGWIKVVAEAAINKDVDNIREGDKYLEVEILEEKWQNILGSNSFKAFSGAIPVVVLLFESL